MSTYTELFSRERLAGYDPDCLSKAVALVVGAGALGQNAGLNLALAGIGEMRIVDKDEFETHNRTRSPAYPQPDEAAQLGMRKARAVAGKLRALMTNDQPTMRYADAWIEELGDGAFKDVSVVLSCVDKPSARAYLSDQARFHSLPFIEGGFEGPQITLSCFPGTRGAESVSTPCWRCSHPDTAGAFSCDFYAEAVERAGFIPAIQNSAATLAGLQCEAAISAVHPSTAQFEARAFDLNIRSGRAMAVRLSTDPGCAGIHRSIDQPVTALSITVDHSVRDLFQKIATHLDAPAAIVLRTPFVWTATCIGCREMANVRQPLWAWEMSPKCQLCGGPFPRVEVPSANSTVVYKQITPDCDAALLNLTCRQIGLAPLAIVEATASRGESRFFELAGSVDDLFN
jgi:molybdopterin/thiamine biosynthesis adenylyltransferase